MKITLELFNAIKATLLKVLAGTSIKSPVDWSVIVSTIKANHPKVKNFMVIRGVLQDLLNRKTVTRFPSIHVEAYCIA